MVDPTGYPDPEAAAQVDQAALPIARALVEARYAGSIVEPQEHGNPGFDFLVTKGAAVVRYVELKSTTHGSGRFFLSEYQRAFSAANRHAYSLLVLSGFDVRKGTCTPHWFDGAVRRQLHARPNSVARRARVDRRIGRGPWTRCDFGGADCSR